MHQQTGSNFPGPVIPGLLPAEQALVTGLSTKLTYQSTFMQINNSYYEGLQKINDLGIAIPSQLAAVRTVVDWPRICVDPLVMRSVVDSFTVSEAPDIADELQTYWQDNALDSEWQLCCLDELVYGRGYIMVGSPDVPGDSPLVTVESPLNVAVNWDPRKRMTTAAYQAYEIDGVYMAVLYTPDQTIIMSRDSSGSGWGIDDRDVHNFGEVPVVRFSNRMRSADREGHSEITPAIKNTTDSACRSLLGMEIAREFYSVPHRYILGATESAFQDAQGNPKSGLQLSMDAMLGLERDENGNLPTVGQFTAADPGVFTKIIDEHAQLMSSYTGFPPSYFGLSTTANPASADAIRVAFDGMNRRGKQVNNQNTDPMKRFNRLVWRFGNKGQLPPPELNSLAVEWVDVETFTPGAMTDAMFKQVQMGAVVGNSDLVRKKLGWSAPERKQLEIDDQKNAADELLAQLANSLQEKDARADLAVATDIEGKQVIGSGSPAPVDDSPAAK